MKYVITADEVRGSGLLKDRIVITHPEDPTKNNDIVLLEVAFTHTPTSRMKQTSR